MDTEPIFWDYVNADVNDNETVDSIIGSFGIIAKESVQSWIVHHVSLLSLAWSLSVDGLPGYMFDHWNFISNMYK